MLRLFVIILLGELIYKLMFFLGFLVFKNKSWVMIEDVMLLLILLFNKIM